MEEASYSNNEIYVAVTVNEKIITNYDLKKEISYLKILNPELNQLDIDKITKIAKNSLVNEIIKKDELSKYFNLEKDISIIDKIYNIYGTYFPGPSPDMANCITLLINSNSFHIANIPIVVSGNSSVSMGGLGLRGTHYGNISSKPHLGKIDIDEWSKEIPFYWSGPTIWAQSMFAVIKTSNPDLLEKINYDYLYGRI